MGVSKGEPILLSNISGNALYAETAEKNISIPFSVDGLDVDASGKTPVTILISMKKKAPRRNHYVNGKVFCRICSLIFACLSVFTG